MKAIKKVFLIILCINAISFAQELRKPDFVDVQYGKYDLNKFDFWKAKSEGATPLVVYIHGGGFTSGTKEKVPGKLVMRLLDLGISVMSINYRLTPEAVFPQHYMDCARAIQFIRFNAREYNIDPTRIGASGSSAGACTSLWIAFHDEMADPENSDPVLRMSTRLSCAAITSGQTTLDPEVIKKIIGELALKHSFMKGAFFGLKADEMNSQQARELIKRGSPITHLTADDPPVWAFYSVTGIPQNVSEAIHHINFGILLKEKMDDLGIECVVRNPENSKTPTQESVDFYSKHLINSKEMTNNFENGM